MFVVAARGAFRIVSLLCNKWALVCGVIVLSSACIRGEGGPKHSKLDYLNGEHYEEAGPTFNGIPLSPKIKAKSSNVHGKVCVDDGLYCRPLRFATIVLSRPPHEISRVESDELGGFQFSEILETGTYQVVVNSPYYRGAKSFLVDSYDTNIELEVKAKE